MPNANSEALVKNEGGESLLEKAKRIFQPTLRDYLKIVFRRKYLIIIPTIVFAVLGIVYSFILPNHYSSRATILIEEKKLLKSAFKRVSLETSINEKLNMIRAEMLSQNNLYDIIQELGMDVEEGADSSLEIERLIQKIQANTQTNLTGFSPGRTVLQVSYTGLVPATVQKFVNTITERYIERQLERQHREMTETSEFIEGQLERYRKQIKENEQAVIRFKDSHIRSVGPESLQQIQQDLFVYQNMLANYSLQIKAAIQRKKATEEQLKGVKELTVSETTKEINPVALAIQNRISERQNQLALALFNYTEEHPDVTRLKKMIAYDQETLGKLDKEIKSGETIKQNPIYQSLLQQKKMAQIDIETLKARRDGVLEVMSERESFIRQAHALQLEFDSLTRDYAITKDVYGELRKQLENTHMTRQIESLQKGTRFEILEPARLPLRPVSPNKLKIWLISLVLGLACSLGLVIGAEFNDHSFRSREDVLRFWDILLLGVVPNVFSEQDLKNHYRRLKTAAALLIFFLTGAGILIFIFQVPILEALGKLQ